MIQTTIGRLPAIDTREQLDEAVAQVIQATTAAVEKYTPLKRPSPYAKRWFTPELKAQQSEVNRLRRKWQKSCAERGREHPTTMTLFTEMRVKRREWTRTIEKTKAAHWKAFLDAASASSGDLWRAAAYMGQRDSYANIPPLRVGDREAVHNNDKAQVLLESFFPKMADPTPELNANLKEEIP